MIPNANRLIAFIVATLSGAFVACWGISHGTEPVALGVLVTSVGIPFGVYVTGKAIEMVQRRKDDSTMAEQIDAESRATTAAKGGTP